MFHVSEHRVNTATNNSGESEVQSRSTTLNRHRNGAFLAKGIKTKSFRERQLGKLVMSFRPKDNE
jgi:hypothetical protein